MTISSTNRISPVYIGAGTNATFAFTFKVFAAADLEVVRVLVSTGAETTLTLTTDYTVSLNGNQNTNPGGSITLVAGNLATGYNLIITSNVANTQPVDLTNQGGFYPEVINDALDRATIQIQQLNDTALNAVHAPVTDGALLMELPAAGIRANKYLAFDASGLPLVADGTSTPAVTSGGDLTFTVNDAGAGVAQDFIFVNDTTEVMRLKGATTRLGIGTAAPSTALDVVGAGKFSGNLTVNTNTLFVDAANNRVGVLNATPAVALDVTGAAAISGNLTVDTNTLFVDAANNRVGIGTSNPSAVLDLGGQGLGRGITWTATGATEPNNNIFSSYSGVGLVFAAGVAPSTSADSYLSPNSASIGRSMIRMDAFGSNAGTMQFYTNAASAITAGNAVTPTERMRITSAGEVFIAGTTDQGAYNLQCNGTGVWGAGAYVNGSDSRIKHDINPIGSCLDLVSAIEPVTFVYNADWSSDQTLQTGFIAQQLQTALAGQPYLDGIVSQGGEYLNVAYQNIIPLLTKSIQELKAIVEAQAARIAALEANV